jgi:hypothetical protein
MAAAPGRFDMTHPKPTPGSNAKGSGDTPSTFVTEDWTRYVAQPVLIALMVAAQCVGLVVVLEIVLPDQPLWPLTILTFIVALVGVYGTDWLEHQGHYIISRPIYRVGEFAIIVLAIRVITWLALGAWPDFAQLRAYVLDPLVFFDSAFTITLIVTIFAWLRSLAIGSLFCHLAITDDEVKAYLHAAKGNKPPTTHDRSPIFDAYFRTWLWGGGFLLLCGATTTFDLSSLTRTGEPLRPEIIVAVLIYALVGFWLLSQGRLSVMNWHWMVFGMNAQPMVGRRWRRSSLRMLSLVVLLAALLPIGSTAPMGGFFDMLFSGVFNVLLVLHGFVVLVFAGILWLLGFDKWGDGDAAFSEPPPLVEMPEQLGGHATPDKFLGGSIFWVFIIVVAVFAITLFLRDRGYGADGDELKRLWRTIVRRLVALWRGVANEVEDLRIAVQAALRIDPDIKASETSPWRFIRVNALTPRQQVRYFYLSALRHAGKRGVKRRRYQTPLEYVTDLTERWPEARGHAEALTAAFLKARYAREAISGEDASTAREIWKRIRSVVKRRSPDEALETTDERASG